ncbi:Arginyl-tRNA--protein transferase 1-like protein [Drosera capensis]
MSEASSSGTSSAESLIVNVGRRRSSCGYCKSRRPSSVSYGLWAHSLTVDDYQDLLDRGWRRSGCFLYKPEMETTCCPAYTIRLKAEDFIPSKDQLRVSKRMQRYLDGILDGKKPEELVDELHASEECASSRSSNSCGTVSLTINSEKEEKSQEENFIHNLSEQVIKAVQLCIKSGELPQDTQLPRNAVKKVSQTKKKQLVKGSEDLLYTSGMSFQIAANLKRGKSTGNDFHEAGPLENSQQEQGFSMLSTEIVAEKIIHAWQQLVDLPDVIARACNGHLNFYSAVRTTPLDGGNQSVTLTKKSPNKHGRIGDCKMREVFKIKKRKIEIQLKRSSFDPEEFALYTKYQLRVHNDTPSHVTRSSYMRFLVDSPLVYVPPTGDGRIPPCGLGSFHQRYLIDGRLVAVGVVDILPKCLSSKYLFWDPDLAFLSLGKFSALQEIRWVTENQRFCPSLQWYYLGYYIHSCSKMRYKAAYHPSELLCPLRYKWVLFDIVRPALDIKKYVVLSDFSGGENVKSSFEENEKPLEVQPDQEDANDIFLDGDEEMVDLDSESSDEDPFPLGNDAEHGDISRVLIGLKGSRVKYKDLLPVLNSSQRIFLEKQLSKYSKVVGAELSERMTSPTELELSGSLLEIASSWLSHCKLCSSERNLLPA